MRSRRLIIVGVMMFLGMVGLPLLGVSLDAKAAGTSVCDDETLSDELKEAAGCTTEKQVGDVANMMISIVLGMLGVVAVGVVIYGGVVYVTSNGDPGKAQKGRNAILYGLVGLVIALLAFSIVNFVSKVVPQ